MVYPWMLNLTPRCARSSTRWVIFRSSTSKLSWGEGDSWTYRYQHDVDVMSTWHPCAYHRDDVIGCIFFEKKHIKEGRTSNLTYLTTSVTKKLNNKQINRFLTPLKSLITLLPPVNSTFSSKAPISSSTPCFELLCTTKSWARQSLEEGGDRKDPN